MEDILVVDDDRVILEAVKRILEREGIVAHCVTSGEEALEKMKERTGRISPKIIRLAKEIGISKVLTKPFLPNVLLDTIRNVMGKRTEWASSTG